MKRLVLMAFILGSSAAFATADEDAAQAGNHPKPNMGPTEWGDPMKIADTTVVHPTTDFVVQTSLGPFEFKRTFFSNKYTWRKGVSLAGLGAPFGPHPNYSESAEWMHNLFSFVVKFSPQAPPEDVSDPELAVRDTNGTYITFGWNVSGALPYSPTNIDTSGARLYLTPTGGQGKYVLVRPGQGRYIYGHYLSGNGRQFWLLTSIETEQYDYSTTGYSVASNNVSLGPTQATISYVGGTAQIDVVSLVDGQSLKFYYNTNGTLDRIDLRNKLGGSPVVAAQYTYTSGRLTGVTDASGRNEVYSYGASTPEFKVTANSLVVTKKTLTTSVYAETDIDETSDRTLQVQRKTPAISPASEPDCDQIGTTGICRNNWRTWFQQTQVTEGDGSNSLVNIETRHFYRPSLDQVSRQKEVCTKSGGTCTALTEQTALWGYFGGTDLASFTDRMGNTASYTWSVPSSSATPYPAIEMTRISSGAFGGNPAMHALDMVYEYAGATRSALRFYEQQVKEESETSVVPGCSVASTTQYKHHGNTNYLISTIKRGCTRAVTGSEQQAASVKYVGVFYFKHYDCEGNMADDTYGRTLEVHGPCLVSGFNATDCTNGIGGIIPITQFEYWLPSEASDRANRLKRKSTFTNNTSTSCSGARRLDTFYNSYDPWGQVLSESDPNGVPTSRTYIGQRLTSQTTAAGTKTFNYDATTNQLTSVQLPAGNFEVYCYRSGIAPNAACSGGTPTDKMMWKAIAATASGASPVERVDYTYFNGKLATESYYEGGATAATRTKRYEADPLGRPTYEQWGSGTGSYFGTKRFDGDGRVAMSGLPYNHPNGLCTYQTPGNERCSQTSYDPLGRPVQGISFPTFGGSMQQTFFTYDYQSNLTGIIPSGQPALLTSEYDDFGRLIAFVGNWTGTEGPSPAAKALQEYDAAGNLVKRWRPGTSGTQLETWLFDSMSRVREAKAGTTLLWANVYDGDATPSTNCPAVATSKLLGRLQERSDSFGNTWFEYDSLGNTLKIRRQRMGTGACSGSGQNSSDSTPDSEFTYTTDGRLVAEKYPHGRMFEYVYGTGGSQHRIVTIKAAIGSSTTANLIQNIAYTAFGGVKSYQFATTGTATVVNHLVGDNGSGELPTSCATFSPPSGVGDTTGRLRMLQVVRSSTNIFRRGYRWDADQLAEEKTCLLDDTTPTTFIYGLGSAKGYDQNLQLKNVSRPSGEFATRGGPFQQRTFAYDAIGNRTALADVGYSFTETIGSRGRLTTSILATGSTSHIQSANTYDLQGRMTSKSRFLGVAGWGRVVNPVADDGTNGAVGAVYKQMVVNGATYEYFYDQSGRRRFKSYPTGANDEFFYAGSNLIEDRGSELSFRAGSPPLDEYVWLDGKPVALIKVKLDDVLNHTADRTGLCTRFGGDAENCGVYFIVSDYLGKPVLMLNEAAQVTGVGEYDSFGLVGTVTHPAETNFVGVPYANGQSLSLATFNQPPTTNQATRMRVRFGQVSTHYGPKKGGGFYQDYVDVVNSSGGLLTPTYLGTNLGAFKTPWFSVPTTGGVVVRFSSDGFSETGYDGVVVDGYEYQRFQTGAQPVWTALRFPGQYFDVETEFAENWNRFYDARDGRYVGPDPAQELVVNGAAYSAYAYAGNNPILNVDPEGREINAADALLALQAAAAVAQALADAAALAATAASAVLSPAIVVTTVVLYPGTAEAPGPAQSGGNPAVPGDPYSPQEVHGRISAGRRSPPEGAPEVPDQNISADVRNNNAPVPGSSQAPDATKPKPQRGSRHGTGERNVSSGEEHSRVPKGSNGLPRKK